jgi:hypothetical protein
MKGFARRGYEYTQAHYGTGRLGYLLCRGCGCTIPRAMALAIRLTDAGIGDYWEDVDATIRNHLSEQQVLDAGLAQQVADSGDKKVVEPPRETSEDIIQKCLGGYPIYGAYPTVSSKNIHVGGCCVGNSSQALYYIWESIVREQNGAAQVNLLLNRASPWLDVDSFLPYEGKVVIRNKSSRRALVRIPVWVDKQRVRASKNEVAGAPVWFGNYLLFDGLRERDVLTIDFPVVESSEKITVGDVEFTCRYRGNTLVDISPRPDADGYPYYTDRVRYMAERTPMKRISRYAAPRVINA